MIIVATERAFRLSAIQPIFGTPMKSTYRPDIDGLRAIAVISVLLYHYGATTVSGGFTGVDVFFVISGFLITSHLKADIEGGTFSVLSFYDKRIRRIVPALFLMLAITIAAGWFFLMPGDYQSLGRSSAYAAFGLGNLYFLWHTGYFDRAAEMQPLLHTWSLGVEEQFYLVWPPLLWLGMKVVRDKRLFLALFGTALALSFAYAVWKTEALPKEAFYQPHPRAWELAIGGLLAFLPAICSKRLSVILEIVGIALIGWSMFVITDQDPFPGYNAVYACVGTMLLLWPKPQWEIAKVLSLSPFRGIGLISYSLYLWHWPVLVSFKFYNGGIKPTFLDLVFLTALSIVLATLSYLFVETPIRRWRPIRWCSVVTGICSCSMIAFSGSAVSAYAGFVGRVSISTLNMGSREAMWHWSCPYKPTLYLKGAKCEFGAPWESASVKGFLWGDSHAQSIAPLMDVAARKNDASFLLYHACPPLLGKIVQRYRPDRPSYLGFCSDTQTHAINFLKAHPEINLVVLEASWRSIIGTLTTGYDPAKRSLANGLRFTAIGLNALLDQISAPGRRIILIGDYPQWDANPKAPFDPTICYLAQNSGLVRKACNSPLSISAEQFRTYQGPVYSVLRSIADNRSDVDMLPLGDGLCESSSCLTIIDGVFLYRDGDHYRRNLPKSVKQELASRFKFGSAMKRVRQTIATNR